MLGEQYRDLVVELHRCADERLRVVAPVDARHRFIVAARAGRVDAVAADRPHRVVSSGVLGAGERRWWRGAKLRTTGDDERHYGAPIGRQRFDVGMQRVGAPLAGLSPVGVVDRLEGDLELGSIRGTSGQNGRGSSATQSDAVVFGGAVGHLEQERAQLRVEVVGLHRVERGECVVRRLADGCGQRRRLACPRCRQVGVERAGDRRDGIADRDVHDGEGAAGAGRTELPAGAERILIRSREIVVDTRRLLRHLVPVQDRVDFAAASRTATAADDGNQTDQVWVTDAQGGCS